MGEKGNINQIPKFHSLIMLFNGDKAKLCCDNAITTGIVRTFSC